MKIKNILIVLLALLFLASCAPPEEEVEEYALSDYFPFLEKTMLSYEGVGNEFAEQDIYFDFIDGNRARLESLTQGPIVLGL